MQTLKRSDDNTQQEDHLQSQDERCQLKQNLKEQQQDKSASRDLPTRDHNKRNSPYQALITPSPSLENMRLAKRRKTDSIVHQGQDNDADDESSRSRDAEDGASSLMAGTTGTISTSVPTSNKPHLEADGIKIIEPTLSASDKTTAAQASGTDHNRSELIMSVADALTNLTSNNNNGSSSSANKIVSEDDDNEDYDDDDEEEGDSSSVENERRDSSSKNTDNANNSFRDDSGDTDNNASSKPKKGRRERAIRFPVKLMNVLSCGKYDHIISWSPDGSSFVVHNPKELVEKVFPHHFKEVKYASFTRKLHRWGFVKILRRKEVIAYSHKNFKRGYIKECEDMRCCKPRCPSYAALAAGATGRTYIAIGRSSYDTAAPVYVGNHNHQRHSHGNHPPPTMTSHQHQDFNRQQMIQDELAYMQLLLQSKQQDHASGLNAGSHNGLLNAGAATDDMALLRAENLVHRGMLGSSPNNMMATAASGYQPRNCGSNAMFLPNDFERVNLRSNLFSDTSMLQRQQQQQQHHHHQIPVHGGHCSGSGAGDFGANRLAIMNAELEAENRAIDRILGRLPEVGNASQYLTNSPHQFSSNAGPGAGYGNHHTIRRVNSRSIEVSPYSDQELSVMDLVKQQNHNLAMITSNNATILQSAAHGREYDHLSIPNIQNIHTRSQGHLGASGDSNSDHARMDIMDRTRNVLASRIMNGQTNGFHGRGI